MKEQNEKEAALRSAVSGKKIKLKVKKSSKDKEVIFRPCFFLGLLFSKCTNLLLTITLFKAVWCNKLFSVFSVTRIVRNCSTSWIKHYKDSAGPTLRWALVTSCQAAPLDWGQEPVRMCSLISQTSFVSRATTWSARYWNGPAEWAWISVVVQFYLWFRSDFPLFWGMVW